MALVQSFFFVCLFVFFLLSLSHSLAPPSLSLSLNVCLSVHLSLSLSHCLFLCPSLSLCLSVYPSLSPFLSQSLSICPSLSVSLFHCSLLSRLSLSLTHTRTHARTHAHTHTYSCIYPWCLIVYKYFLQQLYHLTCYIFIWKNFSIFSFLLSCIYRSWKWDYLMLPNDSGLNKVKGPSPETRVPKSFFTMWFIY